MTVRTVSNLPAAMHVETARCLFAIELSKQSWVIGPDKPSTFGRGKRLPETVEALARRDALLREAAARFCAGTPHYQAAELLHTKLLRYQTSAWSSRDRAAEELPPRLAGREGALLWQILKARDHVPGAALIATVLSREQQ